jgi:hypothetical protein
MSTPAGRLLVLLMSALAAGASAAEPPPLPKSARLAFEEDWASGAIDLAKWYALRKKWGAGNNGVVPENLRVEPDGDVFGKRQNVLVCQANGDRYDGDVVGERGNKTRVGGVLVTKEFFASGRFEVVLKIGSTERHEGGPEDPLKPAGAIPAVWTYAYKYVRVGDRRSRDFVPDSPLYNPLLRQTGGVNEYWSEIDFPEFGKQGDFGRAMYNTFLQNRHDNLFFDVSPAVDGKYHTLVTDWRTKLEPLEGLTDAQVAEHAGFHWLRDKLVPIEKYFGNPLKRLGENRYAVYSGDDATHYLDGKRIAENRKYVPAMAAQLNLGVWLPDWAGPAPWKTATVSVASVKVWRFDDVGDVRGVLTENISDSFVKTESRCGGEGIATPR